MNVPEGSKYQYQNSGFLYRRLFIWFGPSTHDLSAWTLRALGVMNVNKAMQAFTERSFPRFTKTRLTT